MTSTVAVIGLSYLAFVIILLLSALGLGWRKSRHHRAKEKALADLAATK